jgi:hypothetical protein
MRTNARLVVAIAFWGCSASNASAEPIGISNQSYGQVTALIHYPTDWVPVFAQERHETSEGEMANRGASSFRRSASAAAPGAEASSSIDLTTTLSATSIRSTGSVAAAIARDPSANVAAFASSSAALLVNFTLTAPHRFAYAGEYFDARTASENAAGVSVPRAYLFRQRAEPEYAFFDLVDIPRLTTNHAGILAPGAYGLVAEQFSSVAVTCISGTVTGCTSGLRTADSGRGGFSLSLDLAPAPVPEPSTLLLFGVGAAGVIGRRWRRRLAA